MAQYAYDYYRIDVPSDFSEDRQERANAAFAEAEERTRLYVVPCSWQVLEDTGETVIVRRKRFRQPV